MSLASTPCIADLRVVFPTGSVPSASRPSIERPVRTALPRLAILCLAPLAILNCGGGSFAKKAPAPAPANVIPTAAEVLATLPRIYLNTTARAAPAPGRSVLTVSADGNLQKALNTAQPGDVIEIATGATFVGNFVLPNKQTTSTDWITIRPANYAKLPPEGTRMTPAIAAQLNLPKLQAPNSSYTIATALGAHHYRIIGLDIGVVPTTVLNYGLVAFDGGAKQTTLDVVPHDLVLDRSFVHGTALVVLRRCVLLNSASSAVIDSWLSDCHDDGSDSQAIAGYNGPGPYKIVNNYLEAAGENIIFGGADPAIPNLVPSDIEIRRNYLFKPLSWKRKWLIKNHFETKNAQRVLFEGNVLENNWAHGQDGVSVVIKSVNQNGRCTWCGSQDITVRLNLIRNVGAGFNMAASPERFITVHARRITVMDNLITNINVGAFAGEGRGFSVFGDMEDVVIAHNTMMSPTNSTFTFAPLNKSLVRFTARDNILHGGQYGIVGDNFIGGPAIQHYAPGGTFRGNVIILTSGSQGYPPGNFYPNNAGAVGFVSIPREDFRLSRTSTFRLRATDGRDPGADIDALMRAIQGVKQ